MSDKKESSRYEGENIVFCVSEQKCKWNLLIEFTGAAPLVSLLRIDEDGGKKDAEGRFDVSTGFLFGSPFSNNRDGRNVNGARSIPRINNWTV